MHIGQSKMIFTVITLLMLIVPIQSIPLNPRGPKFQNYSVNCVLEVVNRQFVPENDLITVLTLYNLSTTGYKIQARVLAEINKSLKWPIETLNSTRTQFQSARVCTNCPTNGTEIYKNYFQLKYKTQFYLMMVDSYAGFQRKLKLFNTTSHNYYAFLFIYISHLGENYENLAYKMLKNLWYEHGLFNTAVMIPKNNLEFFHIYSLNIYQRAKMCGGSPKLMLMDTCKKGKVNRNSRLFNNKVPKRFKHCTMKAIALYYPPFVIDEDSGFEVEILKLLGERMHFGINISVDSSSSDWGEKTENGSWNGPFNEVIEQSAIAIGNIVYEPAMVDDFDLTVGYYLEHMVWVVPIALPIERWKNIVVIFKVRVWIFCIAYWLISAILFQIGSNAKEWTSYRSLESNFFMSLSVLIGSACSVQPKTFYVKTFFITLAGCSMMLVALYQSLLVTYLTTPILEKQISSVQDILDSGIGVGGLLSFRDFFNVKDDPIAMRIFNMYQTTCSGVLEEKASNWLKRVANSRDICTIGSRFFLGYSLAQADPAYLNIRDEPKIMELNDIIFSYQVRAVVPKGFPLTHRFNRIIGRMINGGLVRHLAFKYQTRSMVRISSLNDTDPNDEDDDGDAPDLSLKHLSGAFFLLMLGYILAVVCFVFELICFKLSKTPRFHKLKSNFKQKINRVSDCLLKML